MKKRALCLIIAVALLLSISISASADSTGVCFTGVGDTLLDLNSMAVFSGGTLYVPGKAFSSFGVYITYFDADATLLLYNSSSSVYFDLNEGTTYDGSGNYYEVSGIFRGGQVYVPVAFVCRYFGVSYSYISGSGNGDIARLKNGSEVLTDSQYIDAAGSLMKTYYNEYFGMVQPITPVPSPSVQNPSAGDDNHSGTYVYLSFIGVPEGKLLDTLSRFGYSASFFVTEEQALASPDTLRRIYGEGHNIGIYCSSFAEECEAASEAVFGACQVMPTLFTSASSIAQQCQSYGSEHALTYVTASIAADGGTQSREAIVGGLEDVSGNITLSVELSESTQKMLPSLLSYLSSESYSVVPLRETYL